MTNSEVVVNDVLVDPRNPNRVLLATDRSGVLASDDGAQTFTASNHGYTHRYVSSILPDKNDPNSILVGVVNDREFGGVFSTRDGGQSWQQKSAGLGGRDVFALQQVPNDGLIAGTNKGIFLLDHNASQWRPINTIVTEKSAARVVKGKKGTKAAKVPAVVVRSVLDARVSDIEVTPKRWLAATSSGLFTSSDQGKTWTGGSVMGKSDFVAVESNGELIVAATRTNVLYSSNNGVDLAASASVLLHHSHSRRDPHAGRRNPGCFPRRRLPEFRFRSDLGACGERHSGQEHQLDRV